MVLALTLFAIGPSSALAEAYETDFVTAIAYQNIGSAATTSLILLFYDSPTDVTPLVIPRDNLAKGASASVQVGSIFSSSFEGTAVMTADQPLAATMVQVPQSSPTSLVKNRPLSNGFGGGSPTSRLGTVLNNTFEAHTIFSVQNAGSASTTVTVKFINTSAFQVHSMSQLLQPGAGWHIDASQVSQLDPSFNGSVVIETSGGAGEIVSSAMELDFGTGRIFAKAYEGVSQGAQTVFMPTAQCKYGTGTLTTTYYAVQNTSLTTSTDVTVTYSNGLSETKSVGNGAKASFGACLAAGMPEGFLGSAIVTSDTTDVIVIGKVVGGGTISTAFVGFNSAPSSAALPYVRYATMADFQAGVMGRTFIAIQNIGPDLPNGSQITVDYIDRDGNVAGTHTIDLPSGLAHGEKVNSSPATVGLVPFGCYSGCTQFGGGAIVEGPGGSQMAVMARVNTYLPTGGIASEDYSGVLIP